MNAMTLGVNTVHCWYMIHLSLHYPQKSMEGELFVWKLTLRIMGEKTIKKGVMSGNLTPILVSLPIVKKEE